MLWAVGRDRFRLTKVRFAHEQYESYHWNYQDNCVCSKGDDSDFRIQEVLYLSVHTEISMDMFLFYNLEHQILAIEILGYSFIPQSITLSKG